MFLESIAFYGNKRAEITEKIKNVGEKAERSRKRAPD
jgi:hypothetical protein